MEEILSSIRKIISDDGAPQETPYSETSAKPDEYEIRDDDSDDLDDFAFDDEAFEAGLPEDEAGVLEALTADPEDRFGDDVFEAETETGVFETANDAFVELPPLDDLSSFDIEDPQDDGIVEATHFEAPSYEVEALDVEPEIEDVAPAFKAFEPDVPAKPTPDPVFVAEPTPAPAPVYKEEPRRMATGSLTDDKTAAAAAGSLSKLLSKVEFGEEAGANNTIEGLVREMLRPMLKEWLDENLADIVDKHVEAEVKRIASRAG